MNINVYDTNFDWQMVLDHYQSLLWTVRYNAYGDFEIMIDNDSDVEYYLQPDNYLTIPESDRMMIIEKFAPSENVDQGNYIVISGRSLESILLRRIVWTQTIASGKVEDVIYKLINDAILNPSDPKRKIPNFIFRRSTDSRIAEIEIEQVQFTGDNLYDVIQKLCSEFNIGFKVTLEDKKFVFELYMGEDRTNSQLANPAIEFSQDNDNLISSKRTYDKTSYCNVTLVAGEDEGVNRKTATVGDASGLDRRELFTDARDISTNNGEVPLSEYNQQLIARGNEKLDETGILQEFESEVDNGKDAMYKLGRDYSIGDLLDISDYHNYVQSSVRVSEITIKDAVDGYSIYPIFDYSDTIFN